jgi:hypothetical protein
MGKKRHAPNAWTKQLPKHNNIGGKFSSDTNKISEKVYIGYLPENHKYPMLLPKNGKNTPPKKQNQ